MLVTDDKLVSVFDQVYAACWGIVYPGRISNSQHVNKEPCRFFTLESQLEEFGTLLPKRFDGTMSFSASQRRSAAETGQDGSGKLRIGNLVCAFLLFAVSGTLLAYILIFVYFPNRKYVCY